MKERTYIDDEIKKDMTYNIYHLDNPIRLPGWEIVEYRNSKSGFEGLIYKKDNHIILVYKGTDVASGQDIKNDLQMVLRKEPSQQKEALDLALCAIGKYKSAVIEATGHSLGASMAQLVSAKTGIRATTFNAYGTADILKSKGFTEEQIKNMNIKNYGNPKDPVFLYNLSSQPGRTYLTNTNLNPIESYEFEHKKQFGFNNNLNNHRLESMGNLTDAVEIMPVTTKTDPTRMLYGYISNSYDIYKDNNSIKRLWKDVPLADPVKNPQMTTDKLEPIINQFLKQKLYDFDYSGYVNPVTGDGKIFSREAISQMTGDEYTGNESAIMAQLKSIGIPYDSDLELASMRGGLVYVRPYTREDGTEVRGYWRSAPTV